MRKRKFLQKSSTSFNESENESNDVPTKGRRISTRNCPGSPLVGGNMNLTGRLNRIFSVINDVNTFSKIGVTDTCRFNTEFLITDGKKHFSKSYVLYYTFHLKL